MDTTSVYPREKDGLWLTKDNRLIMCHGNMTITSYKIMNFFLRMAQSENRLDNLQVNATRLLKECNIRATSYTKLLFQETSKVPLTQISILNEKGNWSHTQIIPRMSYEDGIVTAEIHPSVAPYIQGLTGNFTRASLLIANKCETYAAFKLYEVGVSWLRKGYAYYSIDEWKNVLGATTKSYENFSAFKQRIITPSIKIVNEHTDLLLYPEFIRTGRKTTHMRITIKKKTEQPELKSLSKGKTENSASTGDSNIQYNTSFDHTYTLEEKDTIKKMVEEYRQTQKNAQAYIDMYGVEYCQEQIEYTRCEKNKRKIRSIGGFLRKAIENDYAGNKQKQLEVAKKEEAEHKDKVNWDIEIKKEEVTNQVQQILQQHLEITRIYRELGMDDEKIARWIEKYPEILLLKVGINLQRQVGVDATLISAMLNANHKK